MEIIAGDDAARTPSREYGLPAKRRRPEPLAVARSAVLDGEWTVWGLSRELEVNRNWLYDRICDGTLPYRRHPRTGHYLIADEPTLINMLRQQAATRCLC